MPAVEQRHNRLMTGRPPQERLIAMLDRCYRLVTDTVATLDADGFDLPTRAEGWTIRDLLFHQLLDAQRALVALATPTDAEPDVDDVSYWLPFQPGAVDGAVDWAGAARAHAEFVRAAAAAYAAPESLVDHWRTTSGAAVRAAAATDRDGRLRTQGHVIAVGDLVGTLVVEATVHHLDLSLELPSAPDAEALAYTVSVLERLLGRPLPAGWDQETAVLRATGRLPLDDSARAELGPAERWPLLG